VLDATDGYAHYAAQDELARRARRREEEAARAAAQAEGKDGHKLTLHFPSYLPVMQYADNRALRETLYRAHVTRASDLGKPELDNSAAMRELLELRQEEARLLGYATYADVSLVPKMAESPQQVMAFLRDLAQRARPYAERDLQELRDFARTEIGLAGLQSWDLPYTSEKLKQARYAFSDQEVKQYFVEQKALDGLFHIVETLFEVEIRPTGAGVAPQRALFPVSSAAGQLCRAVLPRPVCTPRQAAGRLDGRPARPLGASRGLAADASGAPRVQLHATTGRQARAADARRGHHALP
jgi:oligopeptidase A